MATRQLKMASINIPHVETVGTEKLLGITSDCKIKLFEPTATNVPFPNTTPCIDSASPKCRTVQFTPSCEDKIVGPTEMLGIVPTATMYPLPKVAPFSQQPPGKSYG